MEMQAAVPGASTTFNTGMTKSFTDYLRLKSGTDALLAWQMGDFFEFYWDDARIVADVLGIALSCRGQMPNGERIPMCGIPADTRFPTQAERMIVPLGRTDHYFGLIVEAGHALAVAVRAPWRDGIWTHRIVVTFDPKDFAQVVPAAMAIGAAR
jgi:hypothetical protein